MFEAYLLLNFLFWLNFNCHFSLLNLAVVVVYFSISKTTFWPMIFILLVHNYQLHNVDKQLIDFGHCSDLNLQPTGSYGHTFLLCCQNRHYKKNYFPQTSQFLL